MTARVRVLLVDDHPVVRTGLRALLAATGAVDVVGEAATGEESLTLCESEHPDVVLMDLQLGAGMDGVSATRAILAAPDPPRVLILTTYDTDSDILRAVEAGAAGYLLKDSAPEQLVAAVQAAARGETVLASWVTERLVSRIRDPQPDLSPRELEIMTLVAGGSSNREIARQLFVSEATVKSHLVHVFTKLGAESRTNAVAIARQRGLIRA
ncbi:MAG: response regulator [Nocardioidaceae bacterium]